MFLSKLSFDHQDETKSGQPTKPLRTLRPVAAKGKRTELRQVEVEAHGVSSAIDALSNDDGLWEYTIGKAVKGDVSATYSKTLHTSAQAAEILLPYAEDVDVKTTPVPAAV